MNAFECQKNADSFEHVERRSEREALDILCMADFLQVVQISISTHGFATNLIGQIPALAAAGVPQVIIQYNG